MARLLMWEAAKASGRDPNRLSFAGTLHRLQSLGAQVLMRHASTETSDHVLTALLG